jgi:hypothetical protein
MVSLRAEVKNVSAKLYRWIEVNFAEAPSSNHLSSGRLTFIA